MDASNMSHEEYFRLHGHLSVERQRQLLDEAATMGAVRAEVEGFLVACETDTMSRNNRQTLASEMLTALRGITA